MTRLGLLVGGTFLGWCAAVGCSSSSAGGGGDSGTGADAAADASSGDSGADVALDTAASCGTVVNGAAPVMEQKIATAAPAPTGGTVVDGTYFLTAVSVYVGATGTAGPTGTTYQSTVKLTGTNYILVSHSTPATMDTTTSGTHVDTGTMTTITQSCPTANASPFTAYSVTGNDVTIYNPTNAGGTAAQVYTKQ